MATAPAGDTGARAAKVIRYRDALRAESAATLDDPSDAAVEAEIRDLFDAPGR
jgi:hypothetical protein